jgi:hypothetical protein
MAAVTSPPADWATGMGAASLETGGVAAGDGDAKAMAPAAAPAARASKRTARSGFMVLLSGTMDFIAPTVGRRPPDLGNLAVT